MRGTDNAVHVALRGQGNRTGNLCARLLSGIDNELGGLIHNLMIVALKADANLLISHLPYLQL